MGIFNIVKGIFGFQALPPTSSVNTSRKSNYTAINVKPASNAVQLEINTPVSSTTPANNTRRNNQSSNATVIQTYPEKVVVNEPHEFTSNNQNNGMMGQNGGRRAHSKKHRAQKRRSTHKKSRRTRYNSRRSRRH